MASEGGAYFPLIQVKGIRVRVTTAPALLVKIFKLKFLLKKIGLSLAMPENSQKLGNATLQKLKPPPSRPLILEAFKVPTLLVKQIIFIYTEKFHDGAYGKL